MLSKSAKNIQDALMKMGAEFKVVELAESTRTASDAAKTIGCTIGQIVKSLIFRTKHTNKPLLILVSGANQINEKSIASIIGEKIEKADAAFTREVTGYAIGGIPPIGHIRSLETFIDEDLLAFQEVWAAAGTPNAVFKLESTALLKLTNGKLISVQ